MPRLARASTAGFFFALSLVLTAGAGGCSDAKEPADTNTTAESSYAGGARSTPTRYPISDSAARFGPAQTVPLPVSGNIRWPPRQLIPGTTMFLVDYRPDSHSPEESAQASARLALWDIETDEVTQFRISEPGRQVVATASDGRFLVWAEGCIMGATGGGWRLYALDLKSGEWWHVDTDHGAVIGDPRISRCDLSLAMEKDLLVYAAAVANDAGTYTYELRSYDLPNRSRSLVRPPDYISLLDVKIIGLSARKLLWAGPPKGLDCASEDCRLLRGLYSTDVPAGDTHVLIAHDRIDARTIMRVVGGREEVGSWFGQWIEHLQLAPGLLLWVARPANSAMAYDLDSDGLFKLSECPVGLLSADLRCIYWTCGENLYRVCPARH